MAQDKVSLFNLAISSMGSRGVKLSSPDEKSVHAEECRLWFDPTRDQVLRAAFWPSAKAFQRLALLKERDDTAAWVTDDPEPGWKFAYAAPTLMLRPRYLSTYERFTTGILSTTQGDVSAIFTSACEPILVYTKQQSNLALLDTQLYLAIAKALGFFISGPLHGKLSFARDAQEVANALIVEARVSMANEEENKIDVLPEWIAARGYLGEPTLNKFTFPFGPLIGGTAGGASVR